MSHVMVHSSLQHIVCYNADADTLEMLLNHGLELNGATDADGKAFSIILQEAGVHLQVTV